MRLIQELPTLFKLSYQGWKEDRASRLAAALAYYTIFSLAPLLVIAIAVAGLLWQRDAAQQAVLNQIGGLVGAQGQTFVASLLDSASHPAQGIIATIVGIVTLLFGALGAFNELHNALNTIWDVEEEKVTGLWNSIRKTIIERFLSFAMILVIGFLMLVSLVVSTALTAFGTWIGGLLPFQDVILQIINLVISLLFLTVLFALIFKYLPDAEIAWRDVWVGAFFTALLFSIGKTLIGLYLGSIAVGTTFGAAGSLVIILLLRSLRRSMLIVWDHESSSKDTNRQLPISQYRSVNLCASLASRWCNNRSFRSQLLLIILTNGSNKKMNRQVNSS